MNIKTILIKTLLFSVAFLLGGSCLFAQVRIHKPELQVHFGTMDYQGDYGDEFFSFIHGIAGGQGINRYFNRSFDAGFEINFGRIKGDNAGPRGNTGVRQFASFQAEMVNLNLLVKYKFTNDYLLKERSRVCPYLIAGFGGLYARSTGINSRRGAFIEEVFAVNFCFGGGLKYQINSKAGIFLQSMLLMPLSDKIDGWYPVIPPNEKYDQFLMNAVGVAFTPWN